jgi:DNA-binding Lrp family transcriptional regulator|tara:strand:- start:97 stop:564 length:468 start_codon:yes stop_codon:yes gene_type:complete
MYREKDLKIYAQLRKDGRKSLTNIAKSTKLPISTVFDKIKYDRAVKKYTALLDFNDFGFSTKVIMMMAIPKELRKEAKKYLCKHQNINSVYKINHQHDFMVEAIFKHIKHLEDFVEALEDKFQAFQMDIHHIIYDIQRETFMEDSAATLALLKQE